MRIRPGKVDVVVIGEGIAALVAALALVEAGKRVSLLAEDEWPVPPGPSEWVTVPIPQSGPGVAPESRVEYTTIGWREVHDLADRVPDAFTIGNALWLGDVPPGSETFVQETVTLPDAVRAADVSAVRVPAVRIHLRDLYAGLADAVQAAGAEIVQTRVRGVSVIEGQILGAVSEAARWDARHDVFASEDPGRAQALSRMAHAGGEPVTIPRVRWPLYELTEDVALPIAGAGGLLWSADDASWLLGEMPLPLSKGKLAADVVLADPTVRPTVGASETVSGAWYLLGMAGWPLTAFGAASVLTRELLSVA